MISAKNSGGQFLEVTFGKMHFHDTRSLHKMSLFSQTFRFSTNVLM